MPFWPPLLLTTATGTMIALPLLPSLAELRRRRDAAPLPTRTDDGKIDNFAPALREYMEPLVSCNGGDTRLLRDGVEGRVLRIEEIPELPGTPIETPIFAPQTLVFPMPVCFSRELYVRGNLEIAGNSMLRAALIEGDAALGERTSVLRWIHVTGNLEAGPESQLFGRASAGGHITLRHACTFERVNAPVIYLGTEGKPAYESSPVWRGPGFVDLRLGRVRANGDFHLRDSDAFQGHIVAVGRVQIEDNVLVIGSVKARTHVEIGSGTHLEGAIVSRGRTTIGAHCYVKGPVLSEDEIAIGPGTQIGTPACPTTVSAPRLRIAPGAIVCGAIWARESGQVTP